MNTKYRKLLKIATLLATAGIIATVSAQVYTYMFIDGTITIGTAKLVWLPGAEFPGDGTISGGTVTMDLDVQPGMNQSFIECLFLKDQDVAAHNLTMTITQAVSSGTFDFYNVHVFQNSTGSWQSVDTLDGMTVNDQYSSYIGNTPLIAGGFYRLDFEIQAKVGTSGSANFGIEVRYE